jgi:hypothetical protein
LTTGKLINQPTRTVLIKFNSKCFLHL